MSTVVDVAWISVVGAAVGGGFALMGSMASTRIARKAAEVTIDGRHNQRLWEKQAAAYEEAVREVQARRTRRTTLTSRGDIGNIGSHSIQELFKAEEPEISRIRAGLRPYTSADVWAAYQAADQANAAF
ncbi:MAG: hypothetical protein ACLQFR_26810 [Streptosporangiaceae bacterium]